MDDLTSNTLDKPSGNRRILTVSDGVIRGAELRRMIADCRAQDKSRKGEHLETTINRT